MKKYLVFFCVLLFMAGGWGAFADEPKGPLLCPIKKLPDCMKCHQPPDGKVGPELPNGVTRNGETAHIYVEVMSYEKLVGQILSLEPYAISHIVIDLMSYGGYTFDGLAMGTLLEEQTKRGKIVEIRAHGLVASAGLLILVSGTKGYRYVDRNALVMYHEGSQFKFGMETVSDAEETARARRFVEDHINHYVIEQSTITFEELSAGIKKKDMWMDAATAIKYGFADKFIGD